MPFGHSRGNNAPDIHNRDTHRAADYRGPYFLALGGEEKVMDSRAQLEEWFKTHWVDKVAPMSMFERHRLHNLAWSSWQASRSKLLVTLPSTRDEEYWFEGVFQIDRFDRDVEKAIRKEGISIKGESS